MSAPITPPAARSFRDIGLVVSSTSLAATLRLCFREQTVEVEGAREHFKFAVSPPRPLLARAVPIKLDAVLIGIAQVKRFADAVIGRAIELHARTKQALERVGEFRARWVEDRHVIQTGCAARRRRASATFPSVEPDVV